MTSDELDSFERSVVDAARDGSAPSASQRSRVRHGLAVKLAASAATMSVGSTALAMILKVGATIAVAGGLAAGGYYATTTMHRQAPAAPEKKTPAIQPKPAMAERPAPAPEAAPEPAPTPTAPTAEPRTERRSSRASAAKTAPLDLGSELAMLGEAKAAIEHGQAQRAGELLHTYDNTFRHGLLAEERMATGVLYLCALGRVDSARTEAGRFVDRFPHSPLRQRVERSCVGEGRR